MSRRPGVDGEVDGSVALLNAIYLNSTADRERNGQLPGPGSGDVRMKSQPCWLGFGFRFGSFLNRSQVPPLAPLPSQFVVDAIAVPPFSVANSCNRQR